MEDNQSNLQPPAETMEAVETPAPKKRRRLWIFVGVGVLVVAIAGAAFVAGRLFVNKAAVSPDNGPVLKMSSGSNVGLQQINPNEKRAPELPDTSPTITGIYVSRQDQVISIGTGEVRILKNGGNTGSPPSLSSSYDGPVLQVVVNHNTRIYKDVTQFHNAPQNGGNVQQVVEPGSLDDLGSVSMVTVWGRRQGERVVADVLVYR